MKTSLFVEFRIHVDPNTNQNLLHEIAQDFQMRVQDVWNDEYEVVCNDATYEVKMIAELEEKDVKK